MTVNGHRFPCLTLHLLKRHVFLFHNAVEILQLSLNIPRLGGNLYTWLEFLIRKKKCCGAISGSFVFLFLGVHFHTVDIPLMAAASYSSTGSWRLICIFGRLIKCSVGEIVVSKKKKNIKIYCLFIGRNFSVVDVVSSLGFICLYLSNGALFLSHSSCDPWRARDSRPFGLGSRDPPPFRGRLVNTQLKSNWKIWFFNSVSRHHATHALVEGNCDDSARYEDHFSTCV